MCGLKVLVVLKDGIWTTPLFWVCRCEEEYIHSVSQEICFACNCRRESAEDARVEDVLRYAYDFHLPHDLVEVVESAAMNIQPSLAALAAIPF